MTIQGNMADTKGPLHVVTGAFGYSGAHIARRLLERGCRVRTLTYSRRSHALRAVIEVRPFDFDRPAFLQESLRGAEVLYNTYWVRFNHPRFTHAQAVRNTLTLFDAARAAGVRRIVHVSITNPSEDSPLEYFRGKAELERALRTSGMSHAILRPAVLFGGRDILINNIAWILRRLPVFGVFGDGMYRLQPIHVDDLARLAVEQGSSSANTTIQAIGPETFTYRGLVRTLSAVLHVDRSIVPVSPQVGYQIGRMLGWITGDVIITREEIAGLMGDLLYVDAPPAGTTRLSHWAAQHAGSIGRRYHSELARRASTT
jgi:NADH dehydrogenase